MLRVTVTGRTWHRYQCGQVHVRSTIAATLGLQYFECGTAIISGQGCSSRTVSKQKTIRQLLEVLGLVNFYRRFVQKRTHILDPPHSLIAAPGTKASDIGWNDRAVDAFWRMKESLTNAALLTYPPIGVPQCVLVDVSDVAIVAVLMQNSCGRWQPIFL